MMRYYKIVPLFLALILVFTMFSAASFAESVTIEVMRNGSGLPDAADDPIKAYIDEALNINLQLMIYPVSDEYKNAIALRMAAGNTPDILMAGTGDSKELLATFANEGLLYDLTDAFDNELAPVKAYLGEDSLAYGRVNGRNYGIPSPKSSTTLSYYSLWVRKDWLDKLGMKVPETIEEFKAVALALINEDPDGNGKNDTVGLSGSLFTTFSSVFGAYGVGTPGSIYEKDGSLTFSYFDEDMPEALSAIADLYEAGAVDPEVFAGLAPAYLRDKAIQGQTGLVYISWSELVKDNYIEQMKAVDSDVEWIQLRNFSGPAEQTYDGVQDIGSPTSMYAIPADISGEKLEKVFELLNFLAGDEGSMLVKYGVEGVNYEMVDGKPRRLSETSFSDIGHVWLYQLLGRAPESEYLSVRFPNQQEYIEFVDTQPRIFSLNGFVDEMEGYTLSDAEQYANEEFVKFINGSRPLSEYEEFLDTLKDVFGYEAYMEYVEETLREQGIIE